ncbi:trypco2 family protein [Streptomyces sp. NPDC005492]|uniref:trypco2 family protein n=1 Tax=Streptomyces sp. NPDC005492 TaxID=3156883 RepID=UPI0033AC5E8E
MIELSVMLRELRAELSKSMAEAADKELRFELGPIEVEVSVAITKEAGVGGKVRFWVVDADAQGKVSDATTQRIKLQLDPKVAATGRRPEVSGKEVPGER